MKKNLKMSIEEAIKYYNSSTDIGFKQLLEDTFGSGFANLKIITNIVYDLNSLQRYLGGLQLPYNLNTVNKLERHLNACYILIKVAGVYNEGVKLNWYNVSEAKYIPYKYFDSDGCSVRFVGWRCSCDGSGLLYYKSKSLAEISYNNFKDIWEDYW